MQLFVRRAEAIVEPVSSDEMFGIIFRQELVEIPLMAQAIDMTEFVDDHLPEDSILTFLPEVWLDVLALRRHGPVVGRNINEALTPEAFLVVIRAERAGHRSPEIRPALVELLLMRRR